MHCLQRDDLDVKRHLRTLAGIELKRNGSGGLISYPSTVYLHEDPRIERAYDNSSTLRTYSDGVVEFTAEEGPYLQAIRVRATFLNLPKLLRSRILTYSFSYPDF